MGEFNDRAEFDCDEDAFWEKCFLDTEFNRRFYVETLKFPEWRLLEQKDDGKKISRRVHISPPTGNMPGPMKKVLGDKFSYVEEGTYDRATHRYTFQVIPSLLADKGRIAGELASQKLGDKKIVRTAKIHVEVKVFMIGSLMEQQILNDLRHSYDEARKFTGTFITEKSL